MCADPDVQRLTWEAYMNKELVKPRPRRPHAHLRQGHGPPPGPEPGLKARAVAWLLRQRPRRRPDPPGDRDRVRRAEPSTREEFGEVAGSRPGPPARRLHPPRPARRPDRGAVVLDRPLAGDLLPDPFGGCHSSAALDGPAMRSLRRPPATRSPRGYGEGRRSAGPAPGDTVVDGADGVSAQVDAPSRFVGSEVGARRRFGPVTPTSSRKTTPTPGRAERL